MGNPLRFTGVIPRAARSPDAAKLLQTAVAAARSGGRHAARHWTRSAAVAERFAHDVKLQLDLECQERVAAVVRRRYPDHRLEGEETTPAVRAGDSRSPFRWIIDPIDGTINFAHGLDNWCCSVAVAYRDRVLAGAVYAPATRELFTATADGPALRNDRPIGVAATATPAAALVLTGLDKTWDLTAAAGIDPFRRLSVAVQKTRILGSAALDICRVAQGRADAFYESGIFEWDVAAAGLIAVRAGGRVTLQPGTQAASLAFLASNKRLHGPLKRLLLDRPAGRCDQPAGAA